MTMSILKTISRTSCALVATGLLSLSVSGSGPPCDPESGVDFRIITDDTDFSPGATAHVMFIVTNKGEPLYVYRGLSQCSSQMGSYFLLIFDKNDREANRSGCASDFRMDKVDIRDSLADSDSWILLKRGEAYGRESEITIPSEKGMYRLKAELTPPSLSDRQREILSADRLRVLQCGISAPILTIKVK